MYKDKIRLPLMTLVFLGGIVTALIIDPITQDPLYHQFADQKTLMGIPNFWNVMSNLPFLLVGLMGLYNIHYTHKARINSKTKIAYSLFFSGVALVSLGSGYYHLWPQNETLVWDRLPMTIAFMALFAIIIGEFISCKWGKNVLWPLIFTGVFSVIYWHITETTGKGDLRLYAVVQFLPLLLIPIILSFYQSMFSHTSGYWFILIAYLLAKVFETFDKEIFNFLQLISGHSIKHVIAAIGVWLLFKSYKERIDRSLS